ncbi:T9SS type A sorting domain-containing protein, partial [bacterium]|nr:T9SS type A sorting domain-containing protein [bacterium]
IIRLLSRTDGYNLNWIQFSQLTAVNALQRKSFSLYPNPAHKAFFLQFNEEKSRDICLLDLQGRVVNQYSTQLSIEKIDIRGIQPGMYIVRV